MRCPACQAEIPDQATTCPVCATVPGTAGGSRRVRRRAEAPPDELALRGAAYDHEVKRLVLLCLAALVPGLGAVLGPLTAFLLVRVLQRGRHDPAFTARTGAWVTLFVALGTTACNVAGLALMALGWYGQA